MVAALAVSLRTSCFKRDNSTARNYVLRENRHRFFIKTLKRHWHASCLKMGRNHV